MIIRRIDFGTIEHVWRLHLWPGRMSAIEPYSAMMFMHDKYDTSFASRPQVFLGGYVDDKLVAVNSLHLAEAYMARSRGLWVDPSQRGHGYGFRMLNATSSVAEGLGAEAIWSFSRKSSIRSYEQADFTRVSSWMDHGEFGPNAYVINRISK